jgi:hypothetical protein
MKIYLNKITWGLDISCSVYTNKPIKDLEQTRQLVSQIQYETIINKIYIDTKEINVVELD